MTPIRDHGPLFKEVHRLLKANGLLFMDSSHMSPSKAKSIVEQTGLFALVKLEGRNMLWTWKETL